MSAFSQQRGTPLNPGSTVTLMDHASGELLTATGKDVLVAMDSMLQKVRDRLAYRWSEAEELCAKALSEMQHRHQTVKLTTVRAFLFQEGFTVEITHQGVSAEIRQQVVAVIDWSMLKRQSVEA